MYVALLGAVFAFALVQISHGIYLLSNAMMKSTEKKRVYFICGLIQILVAALSASITAFSATWVDNVAIQINETGTALIHAQCILGYIYILQFSVVLILEDLTVKQVMKKLNLS
jgi:hypothetical protein